MLEIISRAESGLPVPTAAAVDGEAHSLVLHHWGSFKPTNNARVRELRQLHLQRISSIGEAYNWLVGHDAPGKAWELRGRGRRPGGQRNVGGFDNNAGTRSIVVNGDYRTPGNPSGAIDGDLIETIAQLVVREHLAGDMPSQITHGHTNYVRPDGKGCCQATSCPGDRLLEAIPTINKRIRQLLEDDPMSLPITPSSHKEQIRHVQEMLGVGATGKWDFVPAIKALAVRSGTGAAAGKAGQEINGRMYTHLLEEFIDRPGIIAKMENWVRAHVKTAIAAAIAAGAGGAQIDYGELVEQIGRALIG